MEAWLSVPPDRPTTEITVDVTFLERREPPLSPSHPWPDGYGLLRWTPDVPSYLELYRRVGAPHCWWMRLMMPHDRLSKILKSPDTHIYRLFGPHGVAGFFELDLHERAEPYLNYFGLLPEAQGQGLGRRLLESAIETAWQAQTTVLRVNTCTADHPRALPVYRALGFEPVMVQRERWAIPDDLALVPPPWL
ncbi:GNAT family N-acetyltransferase [Swaminathania salitolerans]|uniref:N-acetyltransferase domain-containing protein n=1 Tax=Swaminathania salitolerans TaxID=182838 RepID=A0A511BNS5_9PROT|nr:GNAT family N-acetyltransferase [Swaminathania salitolerans]GBQ10489.1 acetyltransferase [Swaminathania salitolerans LMG 21291]GEL01304.1 hypothetical protein SSA02_04670 [Swaminathania salitolerans]